MPRPLAESAPGGCASDDFADCEELQAGPGSRLRCRTDARNGTGGSDVRDTSPTMGDVKLAVETRAGERRMRVQRERQNATVDRAPLGGFEVGLDMAP